MSSRFWMRTLAPALAGAVLTFGLPSAGLASGVAAVRAVGVDDWSAKTWSAAQKGDREALLEALQRAPESVGPDSGLGKSIAHLRSSLEAREAKRTEEITRVRRELATTLAGERNDLSLSMALRSAVELSMLSIDKPALLEEPQVKSLIAEADAAARAAEQRSDWMMASELYYRLHLLTEDRGTYKDDVTRESLRLAMIRLYAPERMWHLKNDRRNAEIEWRAKQPKVEGKESKPEDSKPLPKYNPMGDNFREKLRGIEEPMIRESLSRGFDRHVEKTPMDKILRGGIDAVRTLVTTRDLDQVFPGIADDAARTAFLGFLDTEEAKLDKLTKAADRADLVGVITRLVSQNDKTVKVAREALLHEFGNGGTNAMDEFSSVIWPDEVARFERNTQGRFVGVGVQIELDPLQNIRVVTPLDGTPAQQAGIRSGDLIKKVNGVSTLGFSLDQAVDVITGRENTNVTLTIERDVRQAEGGTKREEIDFKLRRARIEVVTVKGWRKTGTREDDWDWFVDGQNKIGYVRLTQFADRTDKEFDRAIETMKKSGLNGLILDLRYNPGGLLDKAVEVVSRFVDGSVKSYDGVVVTTHDKTDTRVQTESVDRGRASLAGVPVVVLVNEGSASASEIVSGALQDYARSGDVKAVVVGQRSYGKGSVQNVWPMSSAGVRAFVKITTQYYKLPGSRMIHRRKNSTTWGVDPDLSVEMLPTQISDALTIRLAADVIRQDENGQRIVAENESSSDPDDLLNKGIDMQLQHAVVLLQTQVPAAVAGSDAKITPRSN